MSDRSAERRGGCFNFNYMGVFMHISRGDDEEEVPEIEEDDFEEFDEEIEGDDEPDDLDDEEEDDEDV